MGAPRRRRHTLPVFVAALIPAVVAARGTAGSSVLSFPEGAIPAWGALHTLCSLQCELRDPTTLKIQDNNIVRNDSVCHSMLDYKSLPSGPEDEVYPASLRLGVRVRRIATRPGRPSGSLERDTVYEKLTKRRVPCANEDGEGRISAEALVVNFLTLTRHSIAGSVKRINGQYELLAVSRFTVGVCVDTNCVELVAVDMASPGVVVPCNGTGVEVDCVFGGTPVLTYRGTDGKERPVSASRDDLLSLGRGVLARHDWLGPAAAAALGVQSEIRILNPQAVFLPDGAAPPAFLGTSHRLNGTPPTLLTGGPVAPSESGGTIWSNAVAWVLCAGRQSVFARDGAVCNGVDPIHPAQNVELNGKTLTTPSTFESRTGASLSLVWLMLPDVVVRAFAPPGAPVWVPGPSVNQTAPARKGPRLPFLAARGLRELNPDSPEERELAAALGHRTALLPVHVWRNMSLGFSAALQMVEPSFNSLEADLVRLSSTYDQSVWGEDQPDQPISIVSIVLAIVVLVAEVGVIGSLYGGTSVWDSRAVPSFSVAVLAGAAALAPFVAQYVLERIGDDWRTVAVRDSILAQLTGGSDRAAPLTDLRGTVVLRSQTLLVGARNGYRPGLMLGLMIGAVVLYGVVSAVLLLGAWR